MIPYTLAPERLDFVALNTRGCSDLFGAAGPTATGKLAAVWQHTCTYSTTRRTPRPHPTRPGSLPGSHHHTAQHASYAPALCPGLGNDASPTSWRRFPTCHALLRQPVSTALPSQLTSERLLQTQRDIILPATVLPP